MDQFKLLRHNIIVQHRFTVRSLKTKEI